MSDLIKEIQKRKTFGIISHPDAGKTTLTEKLLLFGGAIQEAGAVKSNKIKGKADKFCSHVFKVFDSDGSGEIDFTEFLIAISVTAQGDAKKKLVLAFKMYDVDQNGK